MGKKGIRYFIRCEYEIINSLSSKYSISSLCKCMNVSRSGFYKWKFRSSHPSIHDIHRKEHIKLIKEVHSQHPSHGYRWINAFIRNQYGIVFTDNYVHRICKFEAIHSKAKHAKWHKPGNQGDKFDNLVENTWKSVDKPFQIIVSDMTAFWANGVYYELTLYFDVWNKEILGYSLSSRRGDIFTYYDGLQQVLSLIEKEQTDEPIIFHTDQGSVYSSKSYNELLKQYNIKRSMSRPGTPTDNPVNESLNGWIKEELFLDFDLKHSKDIPKLIDEYVYYYNHCRPSYALNYKTPIQLKAESGY